MKPDPVARRTSGRIVTLFLLALCIVAFLATVWNYSRNHAFAKNASLDSNAMPSLLTASFDPESRIQEGQRVVIRIDGDSVKVRGGVIKNLTPQGIATIETDDQSTAPIHSKASISIDGTIAPQPTR
jgi:multidrug resistance efflux pump